MLNFAPDGQPREVSPPTSNVYLTCHLRFRLRLGLSSEDVALLESLLSQESEGELDLVWEETVLQRIRYALQHWFGLRPHSKLPKALPSDTYVRVFREQVSLLFKQFVKEGRLQNVSSCLT